MKAKIQQKPKFIPKPGQIDYTDIRYAPVIACAIQCGDRILILRRSSNMKFYPGLWNGVGGFLDDKKDVKDKAYEELKEELNIKDKDVISIERGQIFDWDEPEYGKTYIIYPILVTLKTDKIKLDWEATEYKWIKPGQIENFKIVPSFGRTLGTFFEI